MDKLTALRVVEAIESVANYFDGDQDHARGVTAYAMSELARQVGGALDVPPCECRWYHDSRAQDCPRTAIEDGEDS